MTYFLRFPSEEVALTQLQAAGFVDETGAIIIASHTYALDVIGIIMQGGEYESDGTVIVEPTPLEGWHVNYLGELPSGWEDYLVTPESPVRMFFGNFGASEINTPIEGIGG
jgi:hypothetical protein